MSGYFFGHKNLKDLMNINYNVQFLVNTRKKNQGLK